MPTTPPFNLNADPRTGQGAYGLVPGALGLPPVYQDVAGAFPNLSGNINQLSTNIGHELAGELDPQTIAMLQNTAAQFGIGQGVPLSPFAGAQGLRHLGLTSEARRDTGAQHLLSALPTVANTLTVNPQTQLDVANRNATLGAAPDPAAAAKEAQRLFDSYLAKLGANVRGGGVSYSPGSGVRNTNAPATNFAATPWGDFSGDVASRGGQQYQAPYAGSGINWGTQGKAPQDLWGDLNTPDANYLNQWNSGGPGAGAQQNPWDAWDNWGDNPGTPDFNYLDEWGAGG